VVVSASTGQPNGRCFVLSGRVDPPPSPLGDGDAGRLNSRSLRDETLDHAASCGL